MQDSVTAFVDARSKRPNAPLIRFIKARDWTCRFPGCEQPAEECDCDHRIDHHDDGPTDRWNLQSLCRLHHNTKTCKLWTSILTDTGTIVWTPVKSKVTQEHGAPQVETELPTFKRRVRQLKELGLTESLEVGYRLSPRGRAVLDRLAPTSSPP